MPQARFVLLVKWGLSKDLPLQPDFHSVAVVHPNRHAWRPPLLVIRQEGDLTFVLAREAFSGIGYHKHHRYLITAGLRYCISTVVTLRVTMQAKKILRLTNAGRAISFPINGQTLSSPQDTYLSYCTCCTHHLQVFHTTKRTERPGCFDDEAILKL